MEAFLEFISSLENWKNIALICGAPFAIGSFFKLLRRDKKKDEQISNLSSIASSQEGQITELKRSVEQLTLIAEYHGKFVDLYGRGMEDSREQRELQDKLRKTELKPNIKLRGSSGTRNYKFINRGQDAKIISVEVIEGKTAISLRNILKGQKLGEGHEFGIDINNQL